MWFGEPGNHCMNYSHSVVQFTFSKVRESRYYLATAGPDKMAVLRRGDTGDWLGNLEGHQDRVWGVCLNNDATIVGTGGADCTARIWDAINGHQLAKFSLPDAVACVDMNEAATRLIVGCLGRESHRWNPRIALYDLDTCDKTPLMTFSGHSRGVRNVIYCGHGCHVLTSSYDRTVRMWECRTGLETHSIVLPHHAKSLELHADGHVVTIAYGSSVIFIDVRHFAILSHRKMGYHVSGASLHPRKETYVCISSYGQVTKYDYDTNQVLDSFTAHVDAKMCCVRYSPDGEVFASSSRNGMLHLWQQNVAQKDGLWDTIVNGADDEDAEESIN
ncbi:hypothetical protein KR009_004251 [Drosophila setifemur]|nr:hypothetical protein KR009_004251 [Drosophila setifemur]